MIYVIGSGPAGVSCAAGLLARGYTVTMLDVGVELEEDRQVILKNIQETWDDRLINSLKQKLNSKNPIKLSHNSSYPYDEVEHHFTLESENSIHCLPSFAQGGLSNVWGAFVEKYTAHELTSWPISKSQLDPHYQAVFKFLNPAIAKEDKENIIGKNHYNLSQQAQSLLKHIRKNSTLLSDRGISVATSQLAANFYHGHQQVCKECAVCQHGCPIDLIYSAKHTLKDLLVNNKFRYIKNMVVRDIAEYEDKIVISAIHRINKDPHIFEASEVFSACGPVISTALVLQALKAFDEKVEFLDSTHFMLPCLMSQRIKNVDQEKLHTLSHLYLKYEDGFILNKPVNLQIYTYMDHYTDKFKQLFKLAYPWIASFLKPIIDRMIVIQAHLHSDHSHKFNMQLKENGVLSLRAMKAENTKEVIKNVAKTLKNNARFLGFTPVSFMLNESKICKSFHYGGSMPMSLEPKRFQTDILGRPQGFKRWHVVDASVFPSILAGSITPTIMANAYRIAMESEIYANN